MQAQPVCLVLMRLAVPRDVDRGQDQRPQDVQHQGQAPAGLSTQATQSRRIPPKDPHASSQVRAGRDNRSRQFQRWQQPDEGHPVLRRWCLPIQPIVEKPKSSGACRLLFRESLQSSAASKEAQRLGPQQTLLSSAAPIPHLPKRRSKAGAAADSFSRRVPARKSAPGMTRRPEVKDLTRGPDGGNPTPRRQGRVWREAGRARAVPYPPFFTARASLKEVVGA